MQPYVWEWRANPLAGLQPLPSPAHLPLKVFASPQVGLLTMSAGVVAAAHPGHTAHLTGLLGRPGEAGKDPAGSDL